MEKNISNMENFDLRAFRKAYNIKQTELADVLGCSQTFISSIEKHERELPKDKIELLRNIYGDITEYISNIPQIIQKNQSGNNINGHHINIAGGICEPIKGSKNMVAILTPEMAKEPDLDIMALVEKNELETRAALPTLPKYEICYRNQSSCMAPWIMPGDQLALQCVPKNTPIFGGEVYALDYRATGIIIRKVYDEGQNLRLVAYNKEFEDVVIKKKDVFSYFRIVGQLRTFNCGITM